MRSDEGEPPIRTVGSWGDVVPAIDTETLAELAPDFAGHDQADLSVGGIDMTVRKPMSS